MFERIFAIHTPSQDLADRGRLLKGTALLMLVATAMILLLSLQSLVDHPGWLLTGAVLCCSLIVFGLAHRGHVTSGGILLSGVLLLAVAISQNSAELSGMQIGLASIIPTLVTGLVLDSTAMLAVGSVTLLARLIAQTVLYPVSVVSIVNDATMIGVSLIILWLIFHALEQTAIRAKRQAAAAQASEQALAEQRNTMEHANAELTATNTQLTSLLELVRDLETPAIPLLDGVLVLPLVGHVDTQRASRLTETALAAVAQHRARIVVIDITGVSVIDTAVAQRIGRLAQAIRLLGARVLLTGIRAEVAQTIVAQGLDFSNIQTLGRLQDGIAHVLSAAADTPQAALGGRRT